MKNNKEILREWDETIAVYPKYPFLEAKKLYIDYLKSNDNKLKDNLIVGTLYVVGNFIENNGLIYLNSASYDMSDIINACNEIWIGKINSGALLNANNFREMFDYDFYNKLLESLNINKLAVGEMMFNIKMFMSLLVDYIKLKQDDINFNTNKFIKYIKDNPKYADILFSPYDDYCNVDFINLFDAIIKSFELEDDDLNITKTKLEKIKYILISNGLEYLRTDIERIVCSDTTEVWLDKYAKEEIMNLIFKGDRLNDMQKDVLSKRYGLQGERRWSLEEVGKYYNVSKERIRQREGKALRRLMFSPFRKKLMEYL